MPEAKSRDDLGELVPLITRVEDEFRRLSADIPRSSEHDQVKQDIRDLRDLIVSMKTTLETVGRRPDAAESVRSTIDKLDSKMGSELQKISDKVQSSEALSKLKDIDRKVPPLATLITAGGALFALLGISWANISGAIGSISDSVKAEAANLQVHAQAASQYISEFGESIQTIGPQLKSMDEAVSAVSSMEGEIATALSAVTLLVEQAGKVKLDTRGDGDPLRELADSDMLAPAAQHLLEAQFAIEDGEFAEARELAQRAKDGDSDADATNIYDFVIGQSFYREGRYLEAIGSFEKALSLNPTESAVLNNIGSCYYALALEEENSDEKRRLLEKTLEYQTRAYEGDGDPTALTNATIALNKLERFEESLTLLESFTGSDDGVTYQLACTQALLGRSDEAIQALGGVLAGDRRLSFRALADEDLISLRGDERFLTLLRDQLGARIVEAAQAAWGDAEVD